MNKRGFLGVWSVAVGSLDPLTGLLLRAGWWEEARR